jgi:hypothetical protein
MGGSSRVSIFPSKSSVGAIDGWAFTAYFLPVEVSDRRIIIKYAKGKNVFTQAPVWYQDVWRDCFSESI